MKKTSNKKVKDNKPKIIKNNKNDPLMIGNTAPKAKEDKKVEATVVSEDTNNSEDITDLFKDEMNFDNVGVNNNSDNVNDAVESINAQADALKDAAVEPIQLEDKPSKVTQKVETKSSNNLDDIDKIKKENDQSRIDESQAIVDSKLEDDTTDDFLVKDFDSGEDLTESIISDLQKKVEDKKNQDLINKNANYELLDAVNYDLPGRGLVYNCVDGHWACVNIKSYSYCQNNYNYDLQNKKEIQCYPSAIYEGDIDCEDEQLNKVSNSASTEFCN